MSDDGGIVAVTAIGDKKNAIELSLSVLLRELKQRLMTRKSAAFGQIEAVVVRGRGELAQGNR
jgi:hypothetical protein